MTAKEFLQTVRTILNKIGGFVAIDWVGVHLEFIGLLKDHMQSIKSVLNDLNLEIDQYTISDNFITGGQTIALCLKGELDYHGFLDYLSIGLSKKLFVHEVIITRSLPTDTTSDERMYILVTLSRETSWRDLKTLDNLVRNVYELGYRVYEVSTNNIGVIFVFDRVKKR